MKYGGETAQFLTDGERQNVKKRGSFSNKKIKKKCPYLNLIARNYLSNWKAQIFTAKRVWHFKNQEQHWGSETQHKDDLTGDWSSMLTPSRSDKISRTTSPCLYMSAREKDESVWFFPICSLSSCDQEIPPFSPVRLDAVSVKGGYIWHSGRFR